MSYLLTALSNDGGQWDMLCNLIEKYGVVPKTAYPESKASSGSREMDLTLTEKLREDACILRKLHKEGRTWTSCAPQDPDAGRDLPPALHLPGRASQDLYL